MFGLYVNALKQVKAAHELRISDRDSLIATLRHDIDQLRREKDEIMNQIKPSLDAANKIAENVLQLLRNDR